MWHFERRVVARKNWRRRAILNVRLDAVLLEEIRDGEDDPEITEPIDRGIAHTWQANLLEPDR